MNAGLDAAARHLCDQALAVRLHAYAPYSRFLVGAALEAEDGQIFTGCNVENVTYGLTRCAEQVAVVKAVSEGVRRFRRIAIATDMEPPAVPCGMCRQCLVEFAEDMEIILVNPAGSFRIDRLSRLLPGAFLPSDLLGLKQP